MHNSASHHHYSPLGGHRRAKFAGPAGLFRHVHWPNAPDRRHDSPTSGPAPRWLEWGLILLAVALAAFTVLHQPKPFTPQSHRAPVASYSPAPVAAASPTAVPSRPNPSVTAGLPREVTIARDFSVTLDYGVVGLRKGQVIQLVEKTPSGYYAVYEDYLLPLKDGDFE